MDGAQEEGVKVQPDQAYEGERTLQTILVFAWLSLTGLWRLREKDDSALFPLMIKLMLPATSQYGDLCIAHLTVNP
jgi:hypothetical protein